MLRPSVHVAGILGVLSLLGCRGPSGPRADDPAVVFTWDAYDGQLRRFELRSGTGGELTHVPVASAAELHGARAVLGGVVLDAHGHGLEVLADARASVGAGARLSADGEWIAYIDDGLHAGPLGEAPVILHESAAVFGWSFDGTQLLVAGVETEVTKRRLELVSRATPGAPPRLVTHFEGRVLSIVGMPDGGYWLRRAGEGRARGEGLYRLDPVSGELTHIHQTSVARDVLSDPRVSVAAGLVAFVSSTDNDCRSGELWLGSYDGSDLRRVTEASCRYLRPDRGLDPEQLAATADGRFVGMGARHSECEPALGASAMRCHYELFVYDPGADELRRITDLHLSRGTQPHLVALPRLD